jgi:hypothetical protein
LLSGLLHPLALTMNPVAINPAKAKRKIVFIDTSGSKLPWNC